MRINFHPFRLLFDFTGWPRAASRRRDGHNPVADAAMMSMTHGKVQLSRRNRWEAGEDERN
jgi:hypothetical protein